MQCDAAITAGQVAVVRPRRAVEWLAICCVAISCVVFVVSLGLTNLFRDGGWLIGIGSLVTIVLTCFWASKLESQSKSGNPDDSTKRC